MISTYIAPDKKRAERYIASHIKRVKRLYGKPDYIDIPNLDVRYPVILTPVEIVNTHRDNTSTTLLFVRRAVNKCLIKNIREVIG